MILHHPSFYILIETSKVIEIETFEICYISYHKLLNNTEKFYNLPHKRWISGRSAVRLAHLVWVQGVAGSNPAAPTILVWDRVTHIKIGYSNLKRHY